MKQLSILGIAAIVILAAAAFFLNPSSAQSDKELILHAEASERPVLTHAQLIWKHALEWCESHGVKDAVNPVDKDGTPSYCSYQFKPDTFALYALKYGIEGELCDYEAQSLILDHMIVDEDLKYDDWRYREFPGCVAKLGAPPRY